METVTSILQGLHKGWWMVSLDLKDAYLHVPIHLSHWRFLPFALRNCAGELIVYQWKVLPFGLATSPRPHLHLQGCLMHPFIEDIFHVQGSANQAARTRDISLLSHFRLSFIINLQKSPLVSFQVMLHLGAVIDTARRLVFFSSPAWTDMIIHANQGLLGLTHVSALRLCQVTGLLVSCHSLVPLCMLSLVMSLSFVDSPERSLRHDGRSHFEADSLIVSSDLVSCGIFGHVKNLCPRAFLFNPFLPLTS